jgi:hypothetical protein
MLADFTYDIVTMTATWRFEGWVLGDHYLISVSDAVTDVEGNRLDGEWVNPTSLTTTNSAVSVFPSGDDEAGGDFNFIATLLPGDANLDLIVDYDDFQTLNANYQSGIGKLFINADFNGDGQVLYDDFQSLMASYGLDLQNVFVLCDLNGDHVVDDFDLDTLAENIGISNPTYEDGDLNGDGQITIDDLDLMFAQFGLEVELVS